jgi:hypothetical protein
VILGIGTSTCWEQIHVGVIPSLRLGKRVVVPLAALEKMLDAPPRAAATTGAGASRWHKE